MLFTVKIIWDNSESNAPLEMDGLDEAREATKEFFRKLREELEAEELEEDDEDDEEEEPSFSAGQGFG